MAPDASIHIVNDVVGAALIMLLFRSRRDPVRRVAVGLVILSGLDGLLKLRFLFDGASTLEITYQLPWIALGAVACGWLVDPPRISRG